MPMEMKNDLDHPDQVHVTGRANRLEAPTPWKARWRGWRMAALAAAIPLLIFLLLFSVRRLILRI